MTASKNLCDMANYNLKKETTEHVAGLYLGEASEGGSVLRKCEIQPEYLYIQGDAAVNATAYVVTRRSSSNPDYYDSSEVEISAEFSDGPYRLSYEYWTPAGLVGMQESGEAIVQRVVFTPYEGDAQGEKIPLRARDMGVPGYDNDQIAYPVTITLVSAPGGDDEDYLG